MSLLADLDQITMLDGSGDPQIVKVGDKVKLAPLDPQTNSWGAQSAHDLKRRLYGEGEHVVANIAAWPCGRKILYLDNEAGVVPEDFTAV